jgi:CPA1 family monovalent cation:H+ antiporter
MYEDRFGGTTRANEPSRIGVAEQAEKEYRLVALEAERRAILELTHRRKVSDDNARKLLREIDLVEVRYR